MIQLMLTSDLCLWLSVQTVGVLVGHSDADTDPDGFSLVLCDRSISVLGDLKASAPQIIVHLQSLTI